MLTARSLPGEPIRVDGRRGAVSVDDAGTHLMLEATDGRGVILITVRSGYDLSREDLVRFAAGVHVTRRATAATAAAEGTPPRDGCLRVARNASHFLGRSLPGHYRG